MKKAAASIVVLGILLNLAFGHPRPVQAAVISWISTTSGYWDDPENWNPQTIPGPEDHVTIPSSSNPITVTVRASASVSSIVLAAPHTLEIEAGNEMAVTNGLQLNGGNLVASGPLLVSGASGWDSLGESSVRGSLTNNGTLTLTGSNHRLRGVLNNNGTIRHLAGRLYLVTEAGQSTTLNNAAPAVYDTIDNVTLVMECVSGSGNLTFNNDGILLKSAGNGESVISSEGSGCSPAFNSNGAIDVLSGTLRFDVGFTSTGSIYLAPNSSLNYNIPIYLVLQGGILTGAGYFIGNLYNLSGVVSPGASTGVLTINGNFRQDPLGVLQIELGGLSPGAQYDRLKINGKATLDGELHISYINGFIPEVGNSFEIMSFQSRSGNFRAVTGTLKDTRLAISQTSVTLETWSPPVFLPVLLKNNLGT